MQTKHYLQINFNSVHSFIVRSIEIVVTPRSSMANEKNKILFWQNWVANQLTFSPFLLNVYLLLTYKMVYFSAELQPNFARIKSRFFSFAKLLLGV